MTEEPVKYIKKVEIQGLWGRYDIVWDLHPDVNVLAGINGSGKTTIISSIHNLVSVGTIQKYIIKKINIFFNNGQSLVYKYSIINDTPKNIEKKSKQNSLYDEILSQLKEKMGSDYRKLKDVEFFIHETLFENREISQNELEKTLNLNISKINTFDTELKSQEILQKVDSETKTELDFELWNLQREYLNYQVNLGKKLKANRGNPDDNSTYFHDKFLEIVDNLFSETNKRVNRDKNELEFLLGDKEISAYQLSSGEKQLLVILLTVLIQDNKPAILLMDEPEISLHFEWQENLINYIRELNPNAQLIIATHSADIIMKGWGDRVFELSKLTMKDRLAS